MPSIKADTVLQFKMKLQAITFRNKGAAPVNFANGLYTLAQGETLNIAAVDNTDFVDVNDTQITFDTTVSSDRNLQILVLTSSDC